jgi:tetratricopeptide (TPR) repeat protein
MYGRKMYRPQNLFFVLTLLITLTGCDYISPFQELNKASDLNEKGMYEKAIPRYEAAISGFSSIGFYKTVEYETRYSYALMLNEFTKDNHPEYIQVARKHYKWILNYLNDNKELISTKAMTLSSMANTYQQEAGYTENEEQYYKLLEKAYSTYKEAAEGLKTNKDWHNLAFTYYNLGETSEWYGDINEAVKWLELAVELDKKYGFDKDLIEDQNYLHKLKVKQKEMLNNSIQPTPKDGAAD